MAAAEAQRYAIVAVGTADLRCAWVEIWRMPGRAAAIDLARDLLDGGYARAVVVQGRGTPRSPTPVGETQVYVAVAAGYRVDAFFPTIPATHVEVRVSVPAHWRALLIAVPRDRAVHPRELVGQVTWRRSYTRCAMRCAGCATTGCSSRRCAGTSNARPRPTRRRRHQRQREQPRPRAYTGAVRCGMLSTPQEASMFTITTPRTPAGVTVTAPRAPRPRRAEQ